MFPLREPDSPESPAAEFPPPGLMVPVLHGCQTGDCLWREVPSTGVQEPENHLYPSESPPPYSDSDSASFESPTEVKIPLPDSLPTSPTAPAALPFFGPQPRPEAELIDAENTSWLPPQHPVGQATFSRTFPRPRPTKRRSTVSYPVRDFAEILEGENRSYMPERHAVDTDTAQDRGRRRNRDSIYNRAMAHIHIPHLSNLSGLSNLSPRSPSSPSRNQNLEASPTSPLPSSSRRHSRIPKLHLQVQYLFGGPGGLSRTPTHTPVTPFISVTEERQFDPVEAIASDNREIRGADGNDAELLEDENTAWAGPTPPPLSAISAISPVINTLTSLAIPSRKARRATISHAPIPVTSTLGETL